MKKILFLILSLITINLSSQTDSIRFKQIETKLSELDKNTQILQSNLDKCHKQWVRGGSLCVFGVVTTGVASGLYIQGIQDKSTETIATSKLFLGIGGLFTLVGSVIMIDSHKWIGKSGLSVSNGGIVYKFKQTKVKKFYDENIKN